MGTAAAHVLAVGIGLGLASVGAGVGDGLVTSKLVEGIGRQPEAVSRLLTYTLISVGLIEALPIIALVFVAFVFTNH
jgi:F-type H+-transporting ATPase subunit c